MSKIEYPDRDTLEWWVKVLRETGDIDLSLPEINAVWYEQALGVIERVQYSYSSENLHDRAAEIFYNTIKAHNLFDGNKRTGILLVYLFYLINGHYIVSKLDVRRKAKEVARSRGRARHDGWIKKLSSAFSKCTRPFVG